MTRRLRTARVVARSASLVRSSSGIGERLGGSHHGPHTDSVTDLHRRADAWQHKEFMTADSDIPTQQDNQQALDDLVALLFPGAWSPSVFRVPGVSRTGYWRVRGRVPVRRSLGVEWPGARYTLKLNMDSETDSGDFPSYGAMGGDVGSIDAFTAFYAANIPPGACSVLPVSFETRFQVASQSTFPPRPATRSPPFHSLARSLAHSPAGARP